MEKNDELLRLEAIIDNLLTEYRKMKKKMEKLLFVNNHRYNLYKKSSDTKINFFYKTNKFHVRFDRRF